MATKGQQTKDRVLATAESIILQRGYSGTSIEDIIDKAGITKGGFFYHFEGKNDLARQLMLRYLEQDAVFFDSLLERARSLTEDPLQQLLLFLKLMAEAMADLPSTHPGCLVASFAYEAQQFDEDVRQLNGEGVLTWRRFFQGLIDKAAGKYPMRAELSTTELADLLTSVIEGGIVMSKVLHDKNMLPQQLLQYRNYLRFVFNDI